MSLLRARVVLVVAQLDSDTPSKTSSGLSYAQQVIIYCHYHWSYYGPSSITWAQLLNYACAMSYCYLGCEMPLAMPNENSRDHLVGQLLLQIPLRLDQHGLIVC